MGGVANGRSMLIFSRTTWRSSVTLPGESKADLGTTCVSCFVPSRKKPIVLGLCLELRPWAADGAAPAGRDEAVGVCFKCPLIWAVDAGIAGADVGAVLLSRSTNGSLFQKVGGERSRDA